MNAAQILEVIKEEIEVWHEKNADRDPEYVIVTDDIKKIKPLNVHRNDLKEVVKELVVTNTEMWHEEDKVRSQIDEVVLKAIRNINPLNQHRNDLIEEVDEIFSEQTGGMEDGDSRKSY